MRGGGSYYACDKLFPFVAVFIHSGLGFVKTRKLTRTNVLYTLIMNKMLFDHRNWAWVEVELIRLQLEIWKFKSDVQKIFAPHYSYGLLTLKFYLLHSHVDDFGRFGSFSFMEAEPFEHFGVLIKKCYSMTSRGLSTRMHETVEIMSGTLHSVKSPESEVHGGFVGTFVLKKKVRGR